jgi:hypothetical protein
MDMNTRLVALYLGHERTGIEIYVNVIDLMNEPSTYASPRVHFPSIHPCFPFCSSVLLFFFLLLVNLVRSK